MVKGYQVMAGYENLILGSAIPGQGEDGIRPNDSRLTARVTTDRESETEAELKHEVVADMGRDAKCKVPCAAAP
jgi:hypothetical protein